MVGFCAGCDLAAAAAAEPAPGMLVVTGADTLLEGLAPASPRIEVFIEPPEPADPPARIDERMCVSFEEATGAGGPRIDLRIWDSLDVRSDSPDVRIDFRIAGARDSCCSSASKGSSLVEIAAGANVVGFIISN